MPLVDLDLEFEDEDERKKSKTGTVHHNVDLKFQSPDPTRPRNIRPPSRPESLATTVRQIPPRLVSGPDKAEAAAPSGKPSSAEIVSTEKKQNESGPEDSIKDLNGGGLIQLREQLHKVEFDSEVKVAVAEFKVRILSDLLGDVKLLDYQVSQLLARIFAKHPDMKPEALKIKKLLADFTTKKRR